MKRKKCLILLSGGIDSAVLLGWARQRNLGLSTLTFSFPGRRRGEKKAVEKLRKWSGSRENFDLTLPFVDPPKAEESCYIPQRNLMYYGTAASLAEKIGASLILGGHIRHDGAVFKDAAPPFFAKLQSLIQPTRLTAYGSYSGSHRRIERRIRLQFPFIRMDKGDIIRAGLRWKVPFEYTWSCSRDVLKPCGDCGSCRERRSGFAEAGVRDPLLS